ncbi:MAG: hypothetical protein M1371_01255 [Actinobacteria bacterium]|nr:hypothetical protein [Actinomycetota bacterium]
MNANTGEKHYNNEISSLIDAEILGRQADEIVEHLKSCVKCRKRYETLANLKDRVSSLEECTLNDEEKISIMSMIPSAIRTNRQTSKPAWQRHLAVTLASAAGLAILILTATVVFRFLFISTAPTLMTASAPAAAESAVAEEATKSAPTQDTMGAAAPMGETAGELMAAETIDFPIFVNVENFYDTAKLKEAKDIAEMAEKFYQQISSDGSISQQELMAKLKSSLTTARLNSDMIPIILEKNIDEIANSNKDEIVISESTRNLLPFYAEKATYEGNNSLIIAYFLKPQKDLYYRYLLVPVANSIDTGDIQDLTTIKK